MRANREDEETGRFFQDRYKATRLVDEAGVCGLCGPQPDPGGHVRDA